MLNEGAAPIWAKVAMVALAPLIGGSLAFVLMARDLATIVALLVVIAAVFALAAATGLLGRFARMAESTPLFASLALIIGTGAAMGLCRDEPLALLVLATALITGLAALGLDLQIDRAGVVNLAGGLLMACGGYAAAYAMSRFGIDHLAALAVAALAGGVVGVVLLAPIPAGASLAAAVATLGMALGVERVLPLLAALGGERGLRMAPLRMLGHDLGYGTSIAGVDVSPYVIYASLALAALVVLLLLRRVARESRFAALAVGGLALGLAGALLAMSSGVAGPHHYRIGEGMLLAALVVLGGPGRVPGILFAVFAVTVIFAKLQFLQELRPLLLAVVVLVAAVLVGRRRSQLPRLDTMGR